VITCLGLAPALDVTYAVPALALGAIHRPSSTLRLSGGKSLNVARALRTLDVAATAIVPLGGPIGDLVRDGLEAEGISAKIVSTSAPTRMCVSIVDETNAAMTEVYEQAPPIDDDDWRGILALVADVDEGWLAVSGAIPAARETDLATALAAVAARGVRLALDVRGGALRETLARTRPELVKINRAEAEETFGTGDAAALAHLLHDAGAAAAIVTDGPGGSVAVDRTGASRVQPPVRGRYTVGSGDSFLAGLLASLSRGGSLPDALRAATGVAAANTLVRGAARFDAAEATRLAALVTLTSAG
jgi:1-phosphofructokinase family hexose kinase